MQEELPERSNPSLTTFSPFHIPFHGELIHDLAHFDFSTGAFEALLSGSVGSGKSILAAHLGVRHCIQYPRARIILARRSLPDLKKTSSKHHRTSRVRRA